MKSDHHTPPRFASYHAFWLFYLRAHARPGTRRLHYAGTAAGIALLATGLVAGRWWMVLAAPVLGYTFAWIGHLAVEGNRPATFGHPLWSLLSDLRMAALGLTGRLDRELRAAGIEPAGDRAKR